MIIIICVLSALVLGCCAVGAFFWKKKQKQKVPFKDFVQLFETPENQNPGAAPGPEGSPSGGQQAPYQEMKENAGDGQKGDSGKDQKDCGPM